VTERQIRLFGDPVLKTPSEPVREIDEGVRGLVEDLIDSVVPPGRAGVAAPQIGVGLRAFSYNVDGEVGHLINPQLDLSEEIQDGDEGCLSIPDLAFPCTRALSTVAHGFNEYGDPVVIEGSEKLARCFQHETDHLDGILFVDRLDRETRKAALRAIRQADWANGGRGGSGANSEAAAAAQIKVSPHPTFGQAR